MYTSRRMLVKRRICGQRKTRLLELMLICTKNLSPKSEIHDAPCASTVHFLNCEQTGIYREMDLNVRIGDAWDETFEERPKSGRNQIIRAF